MFPFFQFYFFSFFGNPQGFDKRINFLCERVAEQKAFYSRSLKNLESMSDQLHKAASNKSCEHLNKRNSPTSGNTNLLQVHSADVIRRRASEPIHLHQSYSDPSKPVSSQQGEGVDQDSDTPSSIGVLDVPLLQVDCKILQPVSRCIARYTLEQTSDSDGLDSDRCQLNSSPSTSQADSS